MILNSVSGIAGEDHNYEISHGLSYTSKELESAADEVKDKAALDQL